VSPKKARLIARIAALLVRALLFTTRIRVDDSAHVLSLSDGPGRIWLFWHNRLAIIPHLYTLTSRKRPGKALTSASKDGEILAAFLECYGIGAIRGSSSRRGAAALREMIRAIRSGCEIAITPDGPRGPCYHLNPGVIALAQNARAKVIPIRVVYSRYWELKSWDRFRIPKPFSRVDITILPLETIDATPDPEAFETARQRLEAILRDPADG
jgi:lysophospholipid acyltransferase (LPLAT)-like uncharacterized protein